MALLYYVDKRKYKKKEALIVVDGVRRARGYKQCLRIDQNATNSKSWVFGGGKETLAISCPQVLLEAQLNMLNLLNKRYWMFVLFT